MGPSYLPKAPLVSFLKNISCPYGKLFVQREKCPSAKRTLVESSCSTRCAAVSLLGTPDSLETRALNVHCVISAQRTFAWCPSRVENRHQPLNKSHVLLNRREHTNLECLRGSSMKHKFAPYKFNSLRGEKTSACCT